MRRIVLTVLVWLALTGAASAQFLGPPQILTQQDTGACASATMCATFTLPANVSTMAFGLAGVSSDTLTFQGTVDGTNWRTLLVSNMSSGTQSTTATASGNYSLPNPGLTQVRVVLTTRVSGTPTVTLSRGFATAGLTPPSSITGGTCTNQFVQAVSTAGVPTCATVDLTTSVTGILPSANGGTANGFFTVAGPAASAKTFTFPNASATVLTSNAAVTVAQGGTGLASGTSGGVLAYTAAGTLASSAALGANALTLGGGAGVVPFTDANWTIEQAGHTLASTTQPRAEVWNAAGQSITTATETALTFDTNITAIPATIHSTSSSPTRLVIPTGGGGFYLVQCATSFGAGAVGTRYAYFKKNGTTGVGPYVNLTPNAGSSTGIEVEALLTLAAGDYVECIVFQNSGGNLVAGTTQGNGGAATAMIVKLY